MESISIQYPLYFVLICIVAGVAYAAFLYWRSEDFRDNKWLTPLLSFLRGAAVTGITLMLLNPLIQSLLEEIKKPLVIVGQDYSSSVVHGLNEDQVANYQLSFDNMVSALSSEYDLDAFSLGSKITDTLKNKFDEKETDLGSILEKINDEYSHLNVGGIIISSDGLYNKGKNPIYIPNKLSVPIYTILMGDTTIPKDISIKNIFHNEVAYLGDRVGVQVDVQASNVRNDKTNLIIEKYANGKFIKVAERKLSFSDQNDFDTHEFELNTQAAGIQRFRAVVQPVNGESTRSNNRRDFFIEVLDSRQKILLIRNAPHPDIATMKSILDQNKNYEFEVVDIAEASSKMPNYDLVILHNLPSARHDYSDILSRLKTTKLPRLFIVGGQTALRKFNLAQRTVEIVGGNQQLNEAQADFNKQFELFLTDQNALEQIKNYPPLLSPFGDYSIKPEARVLATQRISKVGTPYPLITLSEIQGQKEAILIGEGLWKWRLFNFLKNETHAEVDNLFLKMFQYLAVKENKDKFRVRSEQNIYKENDKVFFTAELYNNSFESINDPEVLMSIVNGDREEFTYTFSRTKEAYNLESGRMAPGNYTYEATCNYGGERLVKRGAFTVQEIQLETFNTVADHQLLKALSSNSGGQSFYPSEVDQLADLITKENILKPQVYYTTRSRSAVHLKWIFGILAFLLCVEWFLRRYFGRY